MKQGAEQRGWTHMKKPKVAADEDMYLTIVFAGPLGPAPPLD